MASNSSLAVSEPLNSRSSLCIAYFPAIAIAGVIFDRRKIGIRFGEFLADTLHQRAHIRPITFGASASDKVLASHRVVDLAIADIAAGGRQQLDGAILAQGQLDHLAAPGDAVLSAVKGEGADGCRARCFIGGRR